MGHLGSFQLLAIISKTAMNIVEQVSLLCVGASSGYILMAFRHCIVMNDVIFMDNIYMVL